MFIANFCYPERSCVIVVSNISHFFYSMDSDLFHVLSFDGGETSGLQELCVLEVSWDLN